MGDGADYVLYPVEVFLLQRQAIPLRTLQVMSHHECVPRRIAGCVTFPLQQHKLHVSPGYLLALQCKQVIWHCISGNFSVMNVINCGVLLENFFIQIAFLRC